MNKPHLTQRALDWWESARFQALYVALSFFRFDGESRPAHQQVTPAVSRLNEGHEKKIVMAYKNRMTVADILIFFRQQMLDAHAEGNKDELQRLASYFAGLWEIAAKANDPKMLGLLTDLEYATNHFIMEVDFKAFEAVPSIEAIQELEPTSGKYNGCSAKLIRRVIVREELHPVNLGFNAVTQEKIEPDWIGIAIARGPYQNTFDPLFYKFDGRLLSWHECDTLEDALNYVDEKCGVRASEWEVCEIDLTESDGRFVWNPEEK